MDLGDSEISDIPTRPMRVKVLYSFDQDGKTNCLARCPDVLNIPVVQIDDGNHVGVIDLSQCLRAVVAASPEIASRFTDGDFAIYALDYSEDDTPLVGQGLLSAALAVATPSAQKETMITGRVCTNKLAAFSNGIKETLEVKLRFTPVSKAAANDTTRTMDIRGGMTSAMSSGFDPNAWNPSMQQNRSQTQINDYFNFDALSSGSEQDLALVDDFFGLASTSSGSGGAVGSVGIAETLSDGSIGINPAFSHSAPGSRAGSPITALDPSTRNELLRHQSFSGNSSTFNTDYSRPASRASVRSEVQTPSHQRQASAPLVHQYNTQQQTELYYNEDGQARKRAKVTQTDWRGRSSFGSKSSDLRVTAATASSMHMHRPIAKRASAPGSNLEPPPRVPTPVPQRVARLPHHQAQPSARASMLRQASTVDSEFGSDVDNFSDAIMSSPEEESPPNSINADGTPREIPSSPPVFRGDDLPQPSSPGLPTLPPSYIADSGYMSEQCFNSATIMNSLETDDRSPEAQGNELTSYQQARRRQSHTVIKTEGDANLAVPPPPMHVRSAAESSVNIELEMPGDMNQLPQTMLLNIPPSRRKSSQPPSRMSRPPGGRKLARSDSVAASPFDAPALTPGAAQTPIDGGQSRRGSLALPLNPSGLSYHLPDGSQRPALSQGQPLQRTRTSSNDSEAGSPAPSDTEGRSKGPQRSGSGAQRRRLIQERLQGSIARGEMPQFCAHCGAIETPTWRKLYVKECDGKPGPLDYVEGQGETIVVEVTEHDSNTEEAIKFVIRKSMNMKKTKDTAIGAGFVMITVCNPCGLWFNKFKEMRPSDKWGRKSGTRRSRKQKESEESDMGMSTDGVEPPSDMFFTDQIMPEDSYNSAEIPGSGQLDGAGAMHMFNQRPRSNSMQAQRPKSSNLHHNWTASQLDAALARAVQSSPLRLNGSEESPIEIEDLTPKPTRRLLFPSPRREGEVNSLDDNGQTSLKSMPSASLTEKALFSPKPGVEINIDQSSTNVFDAFTFGKENMAPPVDGTNDQFAYLFEGSPGAFFRTPFKTPRKTPSKATSSVLKTPTLSSRKRNPLSPNPNSANTRSAAAAAPPNDFMTSPSSARYWLRSTPSRLERTPGRRSQAGGDDMSPWSRHMAQMLSDVGDPPAFNSPSNRQFDFSDLPSFTTPGRAIAETDWDGLEAILSSEFASYEEGSGGVAEEM